MKSALNSHVALAVGRNRSVFIVALFAALTHVYFITHPAEFPLVASHMWFFRAMIPLSFSMIPLLWTPKYSEQTPVSVGPKRAVNSPTRQRVTRHHATPKQVN